MAKEYVKYKVIFLHENTHEIVKHRIKNSDGHSVTMKYQIHSWHKTLQKLSDIDTFENIYLIQTCTSHDHSRFLPKGH